MYRCNIFLASSLQITVLHLFPRPPTEHHRPGDQEETPLHRKHGHWLSPSNRSWCCALQHPRNLFLKFGAEMTVALNWRALKSTGEVNAWAGCGSMDKVTLKKHGIGHRGKHTFEPKAFQKMEALKSTIAVPENTNLRQNYKFNVAQTVLPCLLANHQNNKSAAQGSFRECRHQWT